MEALVNDSACFNCEASTLDPSRYTGKAAKSLLQPSVLTALFTSPTATLTCCRRQIYMSRGPGSYFLVLGPKTMGIPEAIVCRILVYSCGLWGPSWDLPQQHYQTAKAGVPSPEIHVPVNSTKEASWQKTGGPQYSVIQKI